MIKCPSAPDAAAQRAAIFFQDRGFAGDCSEGDESRSISLLYGIFRLRSHQGGFADTQQRVTFGQKEGQRGCPVLQQTASVQFSQ